MTENLAAALAAVQAKLPTISKGETAEVVMKTGGKYSYRYADLADVSAVILPMLGAVGLSWITKPTHNDAGRFVLVYKLRHTGGEEEAGEYPLPQSGSPQEIGSAITYARRYALCAVTGVAPAADDDDGAAATHAQRERFEDARPARPAPDPEAARQHVLAKARQAIDACDRAEALPSIAHRAQEYAAQDVIRPSDVEELRLLADARRAELEGAEDRTAEPAEPSGAEPAEQQPMDGDWPEPARPGGSDPA